MSLAEAQGWERDPQELEGQRCQSVWSHLGPTSSRLLLEGEDCVLGATEGVSSTPAGLES